MKIHEKHIRDLTPSLIKQFRRLTKGSQGSMSRQLTQCLRHAKRNPRLAAKYHRVFYIEHNDRVVSWALAFRYNPVYAYWRFRFFRNTNRFGKLEAYYYTAKAYRGQGLAHLLHAKVNKVMGKPIIYWRPTSVNVILKARKMANRFLKSQNFLAS